MARINTAAGKPSDFGYRVQHPVHAVGEVDVGDSRPAIHDRCAGCFPGGGMAAQVGLPDIGFRFDDFSNQSLPVENPHETCTEQFARNGQGGTVVETDRKGFGHSAGINYATLRRGSR